MSGTDEFHSYLLDFAEGKVRVELNVLYSAFQKVHPELATTPYARSKLRELLDLLQLDERLELPKGREHWDVSALPSLPRWIKLPRESFVDDKIDLRSIPWAPELRFLASTRVFVPFAQLTQLQEFFARGGRSKPLVPIKERSLEIFGDEKRLDELLRSSALFGRARLTLETLRCFIVNEPLLWTPGPTRDGPVLVLENAATWNSYGRWNAERSVFSAVVYGCGNRFVDGIASLSNILSAVGQPKRVLYFGDLDPQGLLIPQEASGRAQAANLPAIEPHLWSYEQLLKLGADRPQPWECESPSSTLCDWLGPLAEKVRLLFAAAQRIPQEHVGWEFLTDKKDMH